MANVTITDLPAAGPITGDELVPIVQNGVTAKATAAALAGSPTQQQTFLTVNQESTLPNSRYLGVITPLALSDSGAQGHLVLSLTGAPASLQASGNGLQVKTGPNTLAAVQIAVGAGLSIANPDGTTGNPTISLTGIVSNLASQTGTGFLVLQSGGVLAPVSLQPVANQTVVYDASAAGNAPAVGLADNPQIPGTGGVVLPGGTTAQRPGAPADGTIRYNSTSGLFEGYTNGQWGSFSLSISVATFSAGSTGLLPNTPTGGNIVLSGVLNAASGGTGVGGTLNGYVYANGTGVMTASTTVPTSALSGTISNAQLANNSVTINGTLINLGGAATVTSTTTNALSAGTGLSGGTFDGATAATFAIANTTVGAGSYGSATAVASFTVNAQGQLTAAATTPIAIPSSQITDKGVANGIASLDATGVVPLAQLPSAVAGAVNYAGSWNASTNTPTLSSGIGTKGQYYVVSTAGTTSLNGINLWSVGDWAVFNGSVWEKINGSSSEAFSAITVTGLTGYMFANGTSPATASTTIPTTALSGTISNAQLANSSITVNGALINLGGSATITANTTNALTAGTGLSGGTFNGSAAATFAIANTTVGAGSYGSASSVGTFTVNAQGQLTAAASAPIAIATSQITSGVLGLSFGGTGVSGTPTNGQLLIGNGTGYTLAALTAGSGISITNAAGGITIAATVAGGTVTSVAASGGTTGLTFSGSPITTSGTLTLGGTLVPANGGTGVSTLTGIAYGNGTSAFTAATSAQLISTLGYTPVQQGGGTGQGTNKIYIGWLGSLLGLQVDSANFSSTWPISITGNAATATSATSATSATTATNANNVALSTGTGASNYLVFSAAATGDQPLMTNASLTYNASTGALLAGVAGGTF